MTLKLNFENVEIGGLVLAKVGNPSRDEPLQTSKQLFQVGNDDQALLTPIFLKPFRNLVGHRFTHHSSLEKNEVNASATAIFGDSSTLLEKGCEIAQRLYSKSSHPNIKSGDLCISLMTGIDLDGEMKRAICILKSESVTPFLSISARDGDLQLATEQGINPEKIDKGCLILEHFERKGFYVLTFDRAGSESRFWVRDFLTVRPIPDSALMTKRVAELAVVAVSPGHVAGDDSPPWDVNEPAQEALSYLKGQKNFSLQEFEEKALRTEAAKEKFKEDRKRLEEEEGITLEENFDISKRDVTKAKKFMKSIMKLDTGVEIRLRPKVVDKPEEVLEKGYDEGRKMNYIKVYFNEDLA
ncbi:nucleoid-associated protein [Akkermansiaceae bacterium]|nr:nucleoid-associated protein [Akkermansiaceae bacterium]MDA7888804.1 nucleoid-associated protein [Akkermansiaceae bacterium]MDB4537936.1 nucleoid-associated protein [Akkermansiaceae bacterium]